MPSASASAVQVLGNQRSFPPGSHQRVLFHLGGYERHHAGLGTEVLGLILGTDFRPALGAKLILCLFLAFPSAAAPALPHSLFFCPTSLSHIFCSCALAVVPYWLRLRLVMCAGAHLSSGALCVIFSARPACASSPGPAALGCRLSALRESAFRRLVR